MMFRVRRVGGGGKEGGFPLNIWGRRVGGVGKGCRVSSTYLGGKERYQRGPTITF